MDAEQADDNQGSGLSSDVLPFHALQDANSAYSALQLLTATQPSLVDTIQGMPAHYITNLPVVNVPQVASSEVVTEVVTSDTMMVPHGVTAQPELSISEEALFRNYINQLTSLQNSLQSQLSMASQESGENSSLLTSSDTIQPTSIISSQPATYSPSQYMLVPTQLLPPSSSSSSAQVTMAMSNVAIPPSSLTASSSSENFLTLTAPQLTTIMSQQSPALQPVPSPTDLNVPLAPPTKGKLSEQASMTSSQLATPLEALVMPEAKQANLLEVASREIREHAAEESIHDEDDEEGDDEGFLDENCQVVHLCKQEDTPAFFQCDGGEYPEHVVNEWAQLFKEKITPYFGYVNSLEEAEQLFHVYELCTESKFVGIKRCKMKFEVDASKGRPFRYTPLVICGRKIPFDGVPYYHGGKGMYYCHLGSKRKDPPKNRPLKNPKKRAQSKKVGCKAQAAFRVIARFPEYKLKCDTEHHRLVASQTLSRVMKEGGSDVAVEWRVYIMLPRAGMHTNHEIVSTLRLREAPLDRRLIGRICQLVNMGLRNSQTIHTHVVHFAEHVLAQEGLKWQHRKDICGTRQVWWYRKQMLDLMSTNTLQSSKFVDMIQEVEELCQKYGYSGFIEESLEGEDDAEGTGGKWKKRSNMKKQKCYEQQLKNLKCECITELDYMLKYLQSCSQVEVLARNLADIREARKRFGRELNIYQPDQVSGTVQTLAVDSTMAGPNVTQFTALHNPGGTIEVGVTTTPT